MELIPSDRLRFWLGLPPGPWPPDHYALLGLALGAGDFADIEARVLDRMELLRPHQLLHPELVTEGMNRLAQALVCLTDPDARAAYDRGLGIPPPPFEVVEVEPTLAESCGSDGAGAPRAEAPIEPGSHPPGERQRPKYEVVWEPAPLPYEVVPDAPKVEPPPIPPAFEVVPEEPQEPDFLPPEPGRAAAPAPISRRAVYRRLAAAPPRTCGRGSICDRCSATRPNRWPHRSRYCCSCGRCRRRGKRCRASRGSFADRVHPAARSPRLVRLPHALYAVRVLLPSQRQSVALDWRRGYEALHRERIRLRELAFAARTRRARRGGAACRFWHELNRTPEWVLVVLALAALVFALIRGATPDRVFP